MRYLLLAFAMGCAHAPEVAPPRRAGPHTIVTEARASARAKLEALPECLPSEWESAQSVSAVFSGSPEGTRVRAKGTLSQALLDCPGMNEIRELILRGDPFSFDESALFSEADVLDYLEPSCKRKCIPMMRLIDAGKPSPALGFELASFDRNEWDCSEKAVEEELSAVPVLVWGQLAGERPANGNEWSVRPERMCRGALLPAKIELPADTETKQLLVPALRTVAEKWKKTPVRRRALEAMLEVARRRQDGALALEVGTELLSELDIPAERLALMQKLGDEAAGSGRFTDAARWFEQANESAAAAAAREFAANEWIRGEAELRAQIHVASAERRTALSLLLARLKLKRDPAGARSIAQDVLSADSANVSALAIVAEVVATTTNETPRHLFSNVWRIDRNGLDAARAFFFLGEIAFKMFEATPSTQGEEKVSLLQQTQVLYMHASSLGVPEFVVAGWWRSAELLELYMKQIEGLPGAAEQAGTTREQVKFFLERCVERADALHVNTTAAQACRARSLRK